MIERIQWEPGNGTRYDIVYVQDSPRNDGPGCTYLTWLHRSGSGGGTICFWPGDYIHWSYLMEKMNIPRVGDAAGLLTFLHTKGHTVGMPVDWQWSFREGAIEENNLDKLIELE